MALTHRAVVAALAGVVVVFFVPLAGWGVLVVDAAIAGAVVVDLILAGSVRELEISRHGDTARRLDQSAETTLLVVNHGRRRVRGALRDAWPPGAGATPSRHRIDVPPGERRRLTTTLHPRRRTEFIADHITTRSVGPLGLAARQGRHDAAWRLRVLPAFPSRRHLPEKLSQLRILDGRTAARVRGQGTEFDSLRDYVEGDDPRAIDWRATARRAGVVVRTWRPERDRKLLLVLDTGRTSAARVGDAPRLDVAIDAALLLGVLAARAGDHVEVVAVDDRPQLLARDTDAEALSRLLRAMAGLQPRLVETDARGLAAEVLRRAPHRALVVVFTTLDEAPITEGLLPVLPSLTRRHTVLVAAVSDPQVLEVAGSARDTHSVYDAASAQRTVSQHLRVADRLRRLGVEVVEGEPADFAGNVADSYLALKAAGRL